MNTLTQAQHARLDALAQVRRGPFCSAKVVGLVLGAPIIRDGIRRTWLLNRHGFLDGFDGYRPRPRGKVVRKRHSAYRAPVRRFKLTPSELAKFEGRA